MACEVNQYKKQLLEGSRVFWSEQPATCRSPSSAAWTLAQGPAHFHNINIIINSLAFDLCEHVGRGRLPRQDRLRAGLVHSWQGGQGPAANLNNWLRLSLRMVDMYDYVIGLTLSGQVKYQKNLFRKFFVIDIIDLGRGVRSTLHFSPKKLRI